MVDCSIGLVWVRVGQTRNYAEGIASDAKETIQLWTCMHHILSLSIYAPLLISQAQALVWLGPYPSRLHERLTLCQLRPGVTESNGVSRDSARVVGRQMKCYNGGNRLALGSQGSFALERIHVYSIYEVIGESKNVWLKKKCRTLCIPRHWWYSVLSPQDSRPWAWTQSPVALTLQQWPWIDVS